MVDFEKIRFDLLEQRFKNELEYLKEDAILINVSNSDESENGNSNWILERIKHVELIIENINNLNTTKKKDDSTNDKNKKLIFEERDGLNNMLNEIEKYMYKKEWRKLPISHKITKIKEYIEETYKDKDNNIRKKLIKDLSKHITNNKLKTEKYVLYDIEKCKINSIPALIYDHDNEIYNINI
jgi:hypothetical protein